MARHNKPGRAKVNTKGRNSNNQFVAINYSMAQSAAWRSLGGPATKVWIELHCRFNGGNNGNLSLSYDEAARLLGMSKTTAYRAFKELEEKGFVVMTKRGQWYGRMATTWAVTDKPRNGNMATNDWKRWTPGPQHRSGPTPNRKTASRYREETYSHFHGSA